MALVEPQHIHNLPKINVGEEADSLIVARVLRRA